MSRKFLCIELVMSLLLSALGSSGVKDSHANLLPWRYLLYNETAKLPS